MPLTYSPSIATAYADGAQVAKANLRAHLQQIETAIDNIDTTPSAGVYSSLAEFNAATIPSSLDQISVVVSGEAITYRRQAGANGAQDIQHSSGSTWAKASLTEADLLAATADAIANAEFLATAAGNFTPIVSSETAGLTLSGGSVNGRYHRMGNLIFWYISMTGRTAAKGAGAGPLLVSGFPLASDPNSFDSGYIRRLAGISSLLGGVAPANIGFSMFPGGAYGHLYATYGNGTNRTLTVDDVATTAGGFLMQMSGWYEVAS